MVMGREKQTRHLDGRTSGFEPMRVSEHIESCRAHTASLGDLSDTASQALHEWVEYEANEPHLGTCMDVVRQLVDQVVRHLLDQVYAALSPFGIVAHEIDPQYRAMDIAVACEAQRQILNRARQITLATIFILRGCGMERADHTDELIESLRDLEEGLRTVIDALHPATMSLPTPSH